MSRPWPSRVVVAGLGSAYRRDDGVGVAVARAVEAASAAADVGPLGEPLDLLGRWDGSELAIVVDATSSGAPPGSVRVLELGGDGPATTAGTASTHGIGLEGVWRIARAVGTAPRRVLVVGVEGACFDRGEGFSPAVERSLATAVGVVVGLVEGGA